MTWCDHKWHGLLTKIYTNHQHENIKSPTQTKKLNYTETVWFSYFFYYLVTSVGSDFLRQNSIFWLLLKTEGVEVESKQNELIWTELTQYPTTIIYESPTLSPTLSNSYYLVEVITPLNIEIKRVLKFPLILDGDWLLDYNSSIKRKYKHPVRESSK